MSEDPRQIRTRTALAAALLRMLSDADLETISIAALCQEAGVHRTTFYGHARSIEEFAVDVLTRDIDTTATVDITGTDNPLVPYAQAMVDLLDHIARDRLLYRTLFASRWGGALRLAISEPLRERVRIALNVFERHNGTKVPPYRDQVVAFVTGALIGTIVHWAEVDDEDSVSWAAHAQSMMPSWWPVREEEYAKALNSHR